MKTLKHQLIKKKQLGATLIEVLVALLVFTIGLQGVASLQYQAMKDNFDSAQRSHGVWAAHELINRIRANTAGRENGNYTVDANPCNAVPTSCVTETCSAADMATYDIWDAICQDTLLNPNIEISCVDADNSDTSACSKGSNFTLKLEWNSKSVSDDTANINAGQITQEFEQVFQP